MEKIDLMCSAVGSYQFPLYTEGAETPLVLSDFSMFSTPTRIRLSYADPSRHETGICGAHFTIDCSDCAMKFSDLKRSSGAIPDSLVVSETFSLPPVSSYLINRACNAFWGVEKHPKDVAWDVGLKKMKAFVSYFLIGLLELQPEVMVCKITDAIDCSYSFYFHPVEEPKMFTLSIKITPERGANGFLELESKTETYRFNI